MRHELRYSVFNLFADVDELPELGKRLRLFCYNRFNLFSVMTATTGRATARRSETHVWGLVPRSPMAARRSRRVFMFCYPSVLGYVFNPLTVYYGFDSRDDLCLMIYEVNNTFGGRHSYVIPVGPGEGTVLRQALLCLALQCGGGRLRLPLLGPGRDAWPWASR